MNLSNAIRSDLVAFVEKAFLEIRGKKLTVVPYLQHLCYQLANISRRHAINLPPQHLKTFVGSICFSAWTLGHDPTAKILVLAGSESLAEDIAGKIRDIVGSDWFAKAFPKTRLSKTKSRKMDFDTIAGGALYATSINGNFTGRGADLIVVDDPLDIRDACNLDKIEEINRIFDDVVVTRLGNPETGRIVIIMHRLHENDLCGHVYKQGGWGRTILPLVAPRTTTFDVGSGNWTRKRGELLRPDAYTSKKVKELQKNSRHPGFQLLYQQNPLGHGFRRVKRTHFGRFDDKPDLPVILSIDPSSGGKTDGNSFNVIQVWCRSADEFFLIDQWREQCGYRRLLNRGFHLIKRYRPAAILIERAGLGPALIDEIPRPRYNIVEVVPIESKLERFRQVSKFIYSRKVLLKADAPWLEEFLAEVTGFPIASTDDQMDCATQALAWLRDHVDLKKPPARALISRPGAPLPPSRDGTIQGPGAVMRHGMSVTGAIGGNRSNGPFIQPRVWVEFGHMTFRRRD